MSQETKEFYEFGDFRFERSKRVLWRCGEMVPLAPKATEVLTLLLDRRGDLVERQEIIDAVWSETFVEEGNLNHAVSALRRVMGSEMIQTVPRRGYRFTADVREIVPERPEAIILEKRTVSNTIIEEQEEDDEQELAVPHPSVGRMRYLRYVLPVLIAAALAIPIWLFLKSPGRPAAKQALPRSLAVVPFRSLDRQDDGAFAGGLTESVVQRLGSLENLAVRPTTTVEKLSDEGVDPVEIAKKVNADAVMTGSYQRANGRIRLNVRLLNTSDGSQLWAESFDEQEQDIFKLQDSLSAQAAKYLLDKLTARQQAQLAKRPTDDVEAYKLYTRGRYEWSKRTPDGFEKSIADFRAAIDRDPSFALAYSGLADSYVLLADYYVEAPAEAFPKAKAAALKALECDPNLGARPRTTLAYILATYDWDYAGAEREYKLAIEAEPNYATAHQWYGELLGALRRFDEADVELTRAAGLDPLVPITLSEKAALLYYAGKLDESLARYAALEKEHPTFGTSYIFSAWIYELKGMNDESFQQEMAYHRLQGFSEAEIKELSDGYEKGGREAVLRLIAADLEQRVRQGGSPNYKIPHTYARLRDREKTLEWIDKCIKVRATNIIKIASDPNFDFLRDDPRFRSAIARLNLPS